jgi:hypothetical protein
MNLREKQNERLLNAKRTLYNYFSRCACSAKEINQDEQQENFVDRSRGGHL